MSDYPVEEGQPAGVYPDGLLGSRAPFLARRAECFTARHFHSTISQVMHNYPRLLSQNLGDWINAVDLKTEMHESGFSHEALSLA